MGPTRPPRRDRIVPLGQPSCGDSARTGMRGARLTSTWAGRYAAGPGHDVTGCRGPDVGRRRHILHSAVHRIHQPDRRPWRNCHHPARRRELRRAGGGSVTCVEFQARADVPCQDTALSRRPCMRPSQPTASSRSGLVATACKATHPSNSRTGSRSSRTYIGRPCSLGKVQSGSMPKVW